MPAVLRRGAVADGHHATRSLPSFNRPALCISAATGLIGHRMEPGQSKAAARAWLRNEQRAGSRAARPVLLLSLLGTVLAIGQAWCVAFLLAGALTRHAGHGSNPLPSPG